MSTDKNKYFYGILFSFIAVFLTEVNDFIVKQCLDIVDKSYIFFYKQYYVLLWYVLWCVYKKQKIIPSIKHKKLMFYRCLSSVSMCVLFAFALSKTSIGISQASGMLHPVFVILLGSYILRERVKIAEIFAISLALIGIFLIIKTSGQINIGAVYGVLSAVCMASYIVLTKKLKTEGESDNANIFCFAISFCIFGFIYALLTNSFAKIMYFDAKVHLYFFCAGFLYLIYLHLELKALSIVKASTYSIIEYSNILWALSFDYIFWNALLNGREAIGVLLIIFAKVVLIYFSNNRKNNKVSYE